jgi:hypothetical protein
VVVRADANACGSVDSCSLGAIAGIVIAACVVLTCLVVIGVVIARRRKRTDAPVRASDTTPAVAANTTTPTLNAAEKVVYEKVRVGVCVACMRMDEVRFVDQMPTIDEMEVEHNKSNIADAAAIAATAAAAVDDTPKRRTSRTKHGSRRAHKSSSSSSRYKDDSARITDDATPAAANATKSTDAPEDTKTVMTAGARVCACVHAPANAIRRRRIGRAEVGAR